MPEKRAVSLKPPILNHKRAVNAVKRVSCPRSKCLVTRAGVQVVLAGKDHDLQLAGPCHILHNHCDFKILMWITPIAQFEALRAVTRTGRNHF